MRWEQSIQYASRSDIGFRRANNQDSFAIQICQDEKEFSEHGHLFLIADGMGGHAVGELASKIAADTIPHTYFKTHGEEITAALKHALEVANRNINERGTMNPDFARMGTTCSAIALSAKGAVIAHVGDSRVYRIRAGAIHQLTFDHSLQWELLRSGRMKPDEIFLVEPRHVITRSLGPDETVNVDTEGPYAILPGDTYLLCSDGLTNHVNDPEIGMIAGELPPGEACRLLVNLANLRGGSDNVTVVIARVGDLPAGIPPASLPQPEETAPQLNWAWLAGFWGAGIAFAAGVSLMLLQRPLLGAVLAVVGLAGLVWLMLAWARLQPRRRGTAGEETVLWRPYRSADARLTKKFLNELAGIEADMQRAAAEEQWQVDWQLHDQEFQEAKQALAAGQKTRALRAQGRAIDLLMKGLQEQRRRADHDRRWGRSGTDSTEG